MSTILTTTLKRRLFGSGVLLIAVALVTIICELTGLLSLPVTMLGDETTLHTLARVAVIGCVLAAIGSWEQTPSNEQKEQHHDATI
jgi:hypothetical protein